MQQGTAMTENMVLSGPSVLVEVSGKTNLKEKTYDKKPSSRLNYRTAYQ